MSSTVPSHSHNKEANKPERGPEGYSGTIEKINAVYLQLQYILMNI